MKWIIIVSKKNNVSDVLGDVSDVLLKQKLVMYQMCC